jgi:hypothetical protein
MSSRIARRKFVVALAGAATWPLSGVRAQQGDRGRRIGVLLQYDENEPLAKPGLSAFTQAYRWSIRDLTLLETAVCSPTESTR